MKVEIIATDKPVEARPHEMDVERRGMRLRGGKTASHKEFLDQVVRTPQHVRSMNSDGFLSLSHIPTPPAYECPKCGFQGLFRSPLCARCEHKLTDTLTEGG